MTNPPTWIAVSPADGFNVMVLASLAESRTPAEQASLDRLAAGLSSVAKGEGTPPHLVPTVSDRGFKHMPEVVGEHHAFKVTVFESSADTPHIWLAIKEDETETAVGVHLTPEAAKKLRDQLDYLIRSAGA